MRRLGPVLAIAVLIVGLYLVWSLRSVPEPIGPTAPVSESAVTEPELALQAEPDEPAAPVELPAPLDPVRATPDLATLQGRVFDPAGVPIIGAEISWTALTPAYFESMYVWDAVDHWDPTVRLETTSDRDGHFAFQSAPQRAQSGQTVLWVTMPGFRASAQLLDLNAGLARTSMEFRLEPGPAISVQVVDAAGRPLPGASVDQCGIRTPPQLLSNPTWTAAHRAFFRRATTDAEGRLPAELSEFPATFTLIARVGAQRSQPWFSSIDGPAGEVVLRMGPQFQAGGRVRWPTGLPAPSNGLVTVSGVTNAYQLVLSQARVAADGTWGPLQVPLFGAVRYTFRLEAGGCGAEQHSLSTPVAGAVLEIDFAPQPGFDLPLRVVAADDTPVGGAALLLSTASAGDTLFLQGHTDANGQATLRGIPPGFAHLDVTAAEHPPARLESIPIGPEPPAALHIELGSSAGLRGRVTHAGEPVEDFEIAWWTQALFAGQPPTVRRFEAAPDGRFALEGLPRERITLLACSNEHPRSPAHTVDLSAGGGDGIEIELPAPIAAQGRIVDAFTGDPIPGAVIQQFTNAGSAFVHAWGAPAVARPDGSFALPGLAPGDNRLTIQAAGFADRLVSIFAPDTASLELGPLPLFRGMELVLVHSSADPRGTEGLQASLVAARQHPPQAFGPDGTTRFEDVAPGRVIVNLVRPDGSTEYAILDLPPAERHVIGVGDSGAARVLVAVPEGAMESLADPWISLRERTPGGLRTRSVFLSPEGTAEFTSELGRSFAATLWSAGVPLATRSAQVSGPQTRLLIEVTGREATLEVVDPAGRPIPFAEVLLYTADGWTEPGTTDREGRAFFADVPSGTLAGAISPSHGMRFDVPVEPGPPARPTRLELRADASLHVQLTQAAHPAAGIQLRAMGAADTYLVGYATTDDDGRATFAHLAEGTYSLHVEHPGLFRHSLTAATGTRASATQVAIHPLGALQLTVRRPDGTPVTGAEVDLTHPDLPGSLRTWLAENRVRLDAAPRTDGQGRIELPELPAGPLTWTATGADGERLEGRVDVVAGQLLVVD